MAHVIDLHLIFMTQDTQMQDAQVSFSESGEAACKRCMQFHGRHKTTAQVREMLAKRKKTPSREGPYQALFLGAKPKSFFISMVDDDGEAINDL